MMTERTHPLSPPFATTTVPASNSIVPAVKRDVSQNAVTDGEENDEVDYTIKCICDFNDDDGNTVYCEPCDTWQHILCFYPHDLDAPNRDDFLHKCHTCQPRHLDREGAIRRQKSSRATEQAVKETESRNGGRDDRPRPKKQPSKSHKKKRNPSELHLNGFDHKKVTSHESTSHTKKPKTHRSHASISSQAPKRSPSHTNGHPPSPATTPPDFPDNVRLYGHSPHLKDIYERDAVPLESNDFASEQVKNVLNAWATDKDKMRQDIGQENVDDILLHFVGGGISTYPFPHLQLQTENVGTDDTPLPVKYLTVKDQTQKVRLMGELNGLVGLQADFANSEFYKRVSHPPPFVFFHDHLPLYIDTRTEGSLCRYARRSCRPTCSIDTYLGKGNKYHFMLVNDRHLAAGERLTLPWHFVFGKAIAKRYESLLVPNQWDAPSEQAVDATAEEYEILSELITNLLTEYGGCACDLRNDCSFVKFHRNYIEYQAKLQSQSNGSKTKKSRKPKTQISPTSTGHATNSRDASEGRHEHYDDDDARSTSGSVRSKPQSRDMTPFGPEVAGGPEAHISEREKRKIEAAEKLFEQDQPPRKKKRSSDGPHNNGVATAAAVSKKHRSAARPSISTSAQPSGLKQYKDASTSRQPSASPSLKPSPTTGVSPRSRLPSQAPSIQASSRRASAGQCTYKDSAMQTDPSMDTDSWYSPSRRPTPKRKIVSLATRLMNARIKTNATREARRAEELRQTALLEAQANSGENHDPMSPTFARRVSVVSTQDMPALDQAHVEEDVTMQDGSLSASKPEPPTWPQALPTPGLPAFVTGMRVSPELKVTMPPTPSFLNMSTSIPPTPNGTVTPSSAAGSIAQSPFSNIHLPSAFAPQVLNSISQAPSPIKKKLSLSDYKARLKKPAASTPLENESIPEDSKTDILESTALVDTPAVDAKPMDPLAMAGANLTESKPEGDPMLVDADNSTTTAT